MFVGNFEWIDGYCRQGYEVKRRGLEDIEAGWVDVEEEEEEEEGVGGRGKEVYYNARVREIKARTAKLMAMERQARWALQYPPSKEEDLDW
jgi:hypothetical protein